MVLAMLDLVTHDDAQSVFTAVHRHRVPVAAAFREPLG
jgi:hypothetical protein